MRLHPRRESRRGSAMILGYFLLVVTLGLSMSQSMRSLGGLRLEARHLQNVAMEQLGEAAVDDAIDYIRGHTAFGDPARVVLPETVCSSPNTAWTCLNRTLPGGTATIMATNLAPPVGTTTRKRVRVIVTAAAPNNEQRAYEIVLRVTRNLRGVQGESEVHIGEGVTYRGNISVRNGGNKAVFIPAGGTVLGLVTVGPLPAGFDSAWDLCCDNETAPGVESIRMENDNNSLNGIRTPFDTDLGFNDGVPDNITVADNDNGNSNEFDFYVPSTNPYYPQRFTTGTLPDPVTPEPMPATCNAGQDLNDPIGTVRRFCPQELWNLPVGDPYKDLCGTSQSAYVGKTLSDGSVEYCFDWMRVHRGVHAQFIGDQVKLYTYQPVPSSTGIEYGGGNFALVLSHGGGFSAELYSANKDDAKNGAINLSNPKPTATPLTVYIPQGAADAADYIGEYKVGVWLEGPQANFGSNGSTIYGSIMAPESYVKVGFNCGLEPVNAAGNPEGFVIGDWVQLRQNSLVDFGSSGYQNLDPSTTLLGWRRCVTTTCNP